MVFLKIPSQAALLSFLEKEKKADFTYSLIGASQYATKVGGFDNDYLAAQIGHGAEDFEKSKKAVRAWAMFPPTWTRILPKNTPIEVGENVAMFARFAGLWWRNSCRILYVIDESNRFGFAYGTLPGHIESGEELFLVWKDSDGRVFYSIRAFSRPYHVFAKIGYPIVRLLQAKFRKDSVKSMVEAVSAVQT